MNEFYQRYPTLKKRRDHHSARLRTRAGQKTVLLNTSTTEYLQQMEDMVFEFARKRQDATKRKTSQ